VRGPGFESRQGQKCSVSYEVPNNYLGLVILAFFEWDDNSSSKDPTPTVNNNNNNSNNNSNNNNNNNNNNDNKTQVNM
jgi:hypothetical protein